MIEQLRCISTTETNPHINLALEEYLLENTKENEVILYLWQNQRTVVIGKNQNAWKECRVAALEDDGGFLVRRLSGGGAVFHDLGNLNFTFFAHKENYSVARQLSVILGAIGKLGIIGEASGRNDITVDGQKFSGNAFYQNKDNCFHHGTILIDVDMNKLSHYLSVSQDKLASKGVSSVKSRVVNLKTYCPALTIGLLKEKLIEAFGEVYGLTPQRIDEAHIDWDRVGILQDKFSSWDWKFGRKIPFEYELSRRYAWGEITLQLHVNEGKIDEVQVFSDAMDADFIAAIQPLLQDCAFSADAIAVRLRSIVCENELQCEIIRDTVELISNSALVGGGQ